MPERIDVETVRDLLSELVRCPSVNPGDLDPFKAPYGEAGLVKLLAQHLRDLDGNVRVDEVHPGRPNLLARFEGRDPSRTVMLDAHTDTVSHLNMQIDPFAADVRDGRLYGRGACDTKGPMAAMLLALEAAMAEGRPACNVIFAATCNEEHGAGGARHLTGSGLQADFAIVAEPTELKIVSLHKGVLRACISVRGRAAHSSTPHRGRNAIYAMNRVVSRLEALAGELTDRTPHSQLGPPTLSVTTIRGGTASNTIPDRCGIEIDRRILPSERDDAVKLEIETLVQESCADTEGAEPSVEWTQAYPPLDTDPHAPGVKELEAALQAVSGAAQHDAVAYGTNAGFYARAGIPCVVFGPGSIADAHTEDESIELSQVATAAEVLRCFLAGDDTQAGRSSKNGPYVISGGARSDEPAGSSSRSPR